MTAVSLPDDLYYRAERAARRLHRSRSALYADALAEYLDRHHVDDDAVREALDRTHVDPSTNAWASSTLSRWNVWTLAFASSSTCRELPLRPVRREDPG